MLLDAKLSEEIIFVDTFIINLSKTLYYIDI